MKNLIMTMLLSKVRKITANKFIIYTILISHQMEPVWLVFSLGDAPSPAVSRWVAGGNSGVTKKKFLLAVDEIKRAGHIAEVKPKCTKKVRLSINCTLIRPKS